MTLRLFNTATREEADFAPLVDGKVGIYVCGATVQGAPHVGHMRAFVAFDVLRRWLIRTGHDVTYVRNVTDIGDKIFDLAADNGVEWWAWAQRFEREFTQAYDALGILPPTVEPRATGHIPGIVALISQLLDAGHAYTLDGSVYFDVRSFPDYGSLTNQGLEDMAPAQDSPDVDAKRDARDFALWKGVKDDEPGTAFWDAPFGRGRPGWHIECSAMAERYLGTEFDIHGGGLDLRFPHHENEQAQSRAAGHPFARVWMHSAWLTQSGTKMSKSLGNSLHVAEVLREHSAAPLRLALAGVHYRSMLEYSDSSIEDAEATWARLDGFVRRATERVGEATAHEVATASLPPEFIDALNDDLAVPRALAHIHETVREGNTALTKGDDAALAPLALAVRAMLDVLGLDPLSPQWRTDSTGDAAVAALDALVASEIAARAAAREAKDWAAADAIRDRLAAAGIVLEDGADGVRWSLAQGD